MSSDIRDSDKTRPLFEKALTYIKDVLDSGVVEDKGVMEVAMKTFVGHLKARNTDTSQDALKFMVNRTVVPDAEELRKVVRKSLPEYIG